MAPRSITAALSRTAVAIASLMVAVSVTVGVGLMVGSFRTHRGLMARADAVGRHVCLCAGPDGHTRIGAARTGGCSTWSAAGPACARWDVLRSVDVASPAGPVTIAAVSDEDFTGPRIFVSTDGGPEAAARAVQNGAVLASEPLATRLGLPGRGATVTL